MQFKSSREYRNLVQDANLSNNSTNIHIIYRPTKLPYSAKNASKALVGFPSALHALSGYWLQLLAPCGSQ